MKNQTKLPVALLIVEDDFLIADQMQTSLHEAGFAIAGTVSSAEAAIALATRSVFALAVMDIRLAGTLDGVDAAIELFRRYGIRCIFATAHADKATRGRAEEAQPLGWLQKPYPMSSLVTAVREAVFELKKDDNR